MGSSILMAFISDDLLREVRSRTDLRSLIQETVPLVPHGDSFAGRCPFHGGMDRAFQVHPRERIYHCVFCHATGDSLTWMTEELGLDFQDGVRQLAQRCGVTLPDLSTPADDRADLFEACAFAAAWFRDQLQDDETSTEARAYLQHRDLGLEEARTLSLGYAPSGDGLWQALRYHGILEDTAMDAGLFYRDAGRLVPRFRQRLMFPIHDSRGRVAGFGGRLVGLGDPKYLNSPDSRLYQKREEVYHLFQARQAILKHRQAILVEGFLDVHRMVLAGFQHVVAPLGTKMTVEQASLLARYTDTVLICFDGDRAGTEATERAISLFRPLGVKVLTVMLPLGDDPDTLLRRHGPLAMERLLAAGVPRA